MRAPRLVLATLLLLGLALSGCVADEDGQDATTDDDPVVVTDPADYTYVDNETTAGRAHLHDYWGAETQMTVVEKTVDSSWTWGGDRFERALDIRPDDGQVFPLGTGRIEATLSWTDSPTDVYGTVELFVKTANDTEPRFVQEIVNGETVGFDVDVDAADLPHQTLSSWIFSLDYIRGENQEMMRYDGEVTLEAIAYKVHEIPLFPAHPDQWKNATEIDLLYDGHASTYAVYGPGRSSYCLSSNDTGEPSCFYTHVPRDGAIVPRDADHLTVVVEQDNELESYVTLGYHGADSRAFTEPEPESVDGGTWTYILPVSGSQGDGPYAKQSLWEFELYTNNPSPAGFTQAYRGEYTITVTVHKDPA